MHRALQGRCGQFCGDCKIYIAYSTEDARAQNEIAKGIGKIKGRSVSPEQVKCLGCKGTMTSLWRNGCFIRGCAEERGVEFCYQCQNYPCEQLQDHFESCPESQTNLRVISKIGPDAWLHNMLTKNRDSNEAAE
jgi:hypothetical protein